MAEQLIRRIPFENFNINGEGNIEGKLEGRSYELFEQEDTEEFAILAIQAHIGRLPEVMALGPAVVEQPKGSGRIVNIDLENGQSLGDRWVYITGPDYLKEGQNG